MGLDVFTVMDVVHEQLGARCLDHEDDADGMPDCYRIAEALVTAEGEA